MENQNSAVAPAPDLPHPRRVALKKPHIAKPSPYWWFLAALTETALALVTLVAALLLWAALSYDASSDNRFDFMFLAIGLSGVICSGFLWWLWRQVYRRRAKRDHAELLAASRQTLSGIRFGDGSTEDFTPEGTIVLESNVALAFDMRRRLIRLLRIGSRNDRTIRFDEIWEIEEGARLEVREMPKQDIFEALRCTVGLKRRTLSSLILSSKATGESKALRIAPGFEETARQLAWSYTLQ